MNLIILGKTTWICPTSMFLQKFNVSRELHSMYYTQCTTLNVLHSMYYTQCTTLNVLRSMNYTQWTTIHVPVLPKVLNIHQFLGSSIRLTMESFKCVKVLGRGTFGSVHLVYRKDDKKQKRMAMKTIKKEPVEIIHFLAKIKILDGHWKDASGRFVFIWFQLYWKSLIRDREQNQGFDYTREHMKSERQGIAFITHKLWIITYNLYNMNDTVSAVHLQVLYRLSKRHLGRQRLKPPGQEGSLFEVKRIQGHFFVSLPRVHFVSLTKNKKTLSTGLYHDHMKPWYRPCV